MPFGKDLGILGPILGHYTSLLFDSGSCLSICLCRTKFTSEILNETMLMVPDYREVLLTSP